MQGTKVIDNSEDVIDSRDVIARIEYLADPYERDEEEEAEYKALVALAEEASGYASDWTYGEALIRESYFTEYTQELLEDCGTIPKDLPWYVVIDWDKTAEHIKEDYTTVDFDGVEYYIR